MPLTLIVIALLGLSALGYVFGRRRVFALAGQRGKMHSLPGYYGGYVALWTGVPALLLLLIAALVQQPLLEAVTKAQVPDSYIAELGPVERELLIDDVRSAARNGENADIDPEIASAAQTYETFRSVARWAVTALALALASVGLAVAQRRLSPGMRARNKVETAIRSALIVCSAMAILTTIGIVLSLLFEAIRFFGAISPFDFFFGLNWSPQTALRADQVGASGAFGAVPLFAGTLQIGLIALAVAVPIGLMSAIYLSEYAGPRLRGIAKPLLEILAGVPTVVFGFFALLVVAPAVKYLGESLGIDASNESALAAGLVMGIMIVPFVSSLSDDVINAVPQSLRDGAYALGATSAETMMQVVLPAALPGIVGAVLLAASRAIGETMIVLMAAGLAANLTLNPFDSVTTVTVQIATLLVGDQEFDSAKTLSAFALGLSLFFATLVLNIIALNIVKRYREAYE